MAIKLERLVKTYYEKLEEGKMMGRKCPVCGTVEWPPIYACNACGSMETEWYEMSGRGELLELYMPSPLTAKPQFAPYLPYAYGWAKCEEGPERNVMVRNITKENAEYVSSHLPYPIHVEIVQCDGFKTTVFAIDPIDKDGNPIEAVEVLKEPTMGAPAGSEMVDAAEYGMADPEILERLIGLVAKSYRRDAGELSADNRFDSDLKAPSVVFVGLVADVENEFDVMINVTEAATTKTIGGLAARIQELMD